MNYKGLELDQFQIDAIAAIDSNKSVVVSAPTGSGKTLIADYIINRDVAKGVHVIYTAPIKALSNQKYKEFCTEYGEENIGLITGDVVRNNTAPILIMTTEIYRNMVLTADDTLEKVSYVIFDEIHYINDIERGYVWEESVIFSPEHIRMLCLSATIPNADEFASWIRAIKEHKVEVIHYDHRPVPLHRSFYGPEAGISTLKGMKDALNVPDYYRVRGGRRRPKLKKPDHVELIKQLDGKLPCLFFTLSRMGCQNNAKELFLRSKFENNPEISKRVRKKLTSTPSEINNLPSTALLRQTLPHGIGFHHAGLLPVLKELVEELFAEGLIKVLYTTETFAVGINMPAKTVCIESLRKFDGIQFRFMNSKEYFQIAGRAGRRGIDKEGFVYTMIDRRDFDYGKIKSVTEIDKDPIKSQFKLSVNTVLNLINQHNREEIETIIGMNFHAFQKYHKNFKKKKTKNHHVYESYKRKLTKLGYVKDGKLTEKGLFGTHIYADEIVICEMFGTDYWKNLNTYQMMLFLAAICYEARERTKFFNQVRSDDVKIVTKVILKNQELKRDKRFKEIYDLTALMDPTFNGKSLFDFIDNTTLLEGDIIRLLRQIIDRVRQIRHATHDPDLQKAMREIQDRIHESLKEIDPL